MILDNPGKVIEDVQEAIYDTLDKKKYPAVNVRFTHIPKTTPLSHVRIEDENKLISVQGIVKRTSDIRKRCVVAVFKCPSGHYTSKYQGWGTFNEPDGCEGEGCRFRKLDFVPKRSKFVDFQRLTIQESSENVRGGEQPQTINVEVSDDLCGKLLPGDKVTLNGRIKSFQLTAKGQKSVDFGYFFELNSFDPVTRDYDEVQISDEDLKSIEKIAKDNPLAAISASIAPSIYGYADIKNAIALQLIGGNYERDDETGHSQRADIHIGICGDPGTAKSELVRQAVKISPRGIYVNAKSSTAAGLTVSVTKDEMDGRWVAEAGALCLADKGICGIDEMNLLHKNEQASLHEAMEGQQISIAKAGLVCSMNARSAILAAMNPKYGRFDLWDSENSLVEQVDISPPLMSRFDLMFLMTDQPEEKHDTKLALHILHNRKMSAKRRNKTITEEELREISPTIPGSLLRKYIAYSKTLSAPESTDTADKLITDFFVKLRMKNNDGNVAFTPRALEAAARLAEASARMRLSPTVEKKDAEIALAVLHASLKQVATDPATGELDINRVIGVPAKKHKLVTTIRNTMIELNGKQETIATRVLLDALALKGFSDEDMIADTMDNMRLAGDLLEARRGHWKLN